MFSNYLKIAWRDLIANKTYSLLNIIGLSSALICFVFIALWINDEWSYDRFNEKADRIYRVAGMVFGETETFEQACSAVPLGPALKADFAEVENFVRLDMNDALVKNGNQMFMEDGILLTDPTFFDVFSYPLTVGDPNTALKDPFCMVLTESMAQKYFGRDNPIGKNLVIMLHDSTGRGVSYKITGIVQDAPRNAHFTFNFLVSFETLIAYNRAELTSNDAWANNSYYTYILLRKGVDAVAFASKLPQFYDRHVMPILRKSGISKPNSAYTLMPLTDIYLKSHVRYEIAPTSSLANLYIFGSVGLFILLIAGINYVNLATARSMKRAKEVGIKKVMGVMKRQLMFQYLLESVLVTLFSLALSLVACDLLQPAFHQITGKDIHLFNSPILLGFAIGIAIILGVLSGIYPAFFIASYQPITVLKGSFSTSGEGVWLRKSLVVLQFTITIILLISILVINSQMSFIQNKDLGYDKEALLNIKVNGDIDVQRNIEPFKNDLLKSPLIKSITTSNSILVGGAGNNGIETIDDHGRKINTNIYRIRVDYDFIPTMGIKVVAGRNFSVAFPTDARTDSAQNYILNEAAMKALGWQNTEHALDKPIMMNNRDGKVVGIVKDFHFNSLQHKIEPLVMHLRDFNFSRIILKIERSKAQSAIAYVENQWKQHFPTAFLDYDFVDKKLGEQYKAEARFSRIFFYFSLLSIIIACLGLYGLTSFATEQRKKEIGIRKVLGAGITSVFNLLSKDFLNLVLISAIIASPVSWWVMHAWLQDFAYRIDMSWWMFSIAGSFVLLIALLTVSYQSIKAAVSNPIKSLRTE